jgi:hypothetical protein
MTQRVSFRGILSGPSGESPCTVSAIEVTAVITGAVEGYTDYSIISVTSKLPDGHYDLLANGKAIPVICHNGSWIFPSSV